MYTTLLNTCLGSVRLVSILRCLFRYWDVGLFVWQYVRNTTEHMFWQCSFCFRTEMSVSVLRCRVVCVKTICTQHVWVLFVLFQYWDVGLCVKTRRTQHHWTRLVTVHFVQYWDVGLCVKTMCTEHFWTQLVHSVVFNNPLTQKQNAQDESWIDQQDVDLDQRSNLQMRVMFHPNTETGWTIPKHTKTLWGWLGVCPVVCVTEHVVSLLFVV